jgi:hypothetical protein
MDEDQHDAEDTALAAALRALQGDGADGPVGVEEDDPEMSFGGGELDESYSDDLGVDGDIDVDPTVLERASAMLMESLPIRQQQDQDQEQPQYLLPPQQQQQHQHQQDDETQLLQELLTTIPAGAAVNDLAARQLLAMLDNHRRRQQQQQHHAAEALQQRQAHAASMRPQMVQKHYFTISVDGTWL